MNKQIIAPHVKEVARALTIEISEDEIEKELLEYTGRYGIPIDQAKRSMVAKYGGELSSMRGGVKKSVAEVTGDERSVDLLVRIIAVNRRTVTVQGNDKDIITGIMADETGAIPFTSWDSNIQMEKGDTLEIKNAYAKYFRDEAQINLGDRVSVKKVDESLVPPYQPEPSDKTVSELRIGDRNVTVKARIMSCEDREITTAEGQSKMMFSGTLADETGRVPFTAWHDFSLKKGEGVSISNAYVKRWRGTPQLVFDENSRVEQDDSLPKAKKLAKESVVPLDELAYRGGASDVVVEGTVVDVRPGSGIIYRCPECRRVTDEGSGECKIHGDVDGEVDLRVKGILDDGRGAVTFFLDKNTTEKIAGITLEELMNVGNQREAKSRKRLEDLLITRDLSLRGNATKEEYGLTLIVNEAFLKEIDLEEEARALTESMEEYI